MKAGIQICRRQKSDVKEHLGHNILPFSESLPKETDA